MPKATKKAVVVSSDNGKFTIRLSPEEGRLLDNAITVMGGSPMASAKTVTVSNSLLELPNWSYVGKVPVALKASEEQAMLIHDAMYVIYEMHESGSFDSHTSRVAQAIMDENE